MGRLDGKTAIVTGAAGAIGTATVLRFVAEGANVVATDLTVPDYPDADAAAILGLVHDVREEADWARVVSAAQEKFGGVDILVNNAGVSIMPGGAQDLESVTLDHWRAVNAINVEGTLLGCQAAIGAMKEKGGAIVNLSSVAALNPSPKLIAYGATKAAVRHMTRTVAAHCNERGYKIRCNSIHPGWTLTPLVHASRTPEELAVQKTRIPMGRFAETEEMAAAILYLVSDESAYMTGAKLVIDGGIVGE